MKDKRIAHPHAAEAGNPDTPAERLVLLSRERALVSLVAANPSTPASTLEILAKDVDVSVRRAVAQNPNTPVKILLSLAHEFPQEFLHNPLIPLLNLSRPDFIKSAPSSLWWQLLRCEDAPLLWLRWIQQQIIRFWGNMGRDILAAVDAHIAVAGEVSGEWEKDIAKELDEYEQNVVSSRGAVIVTRDVFLPFMLSLPYTMRNWLENEYQLDKEAVKLMLHYFPHPSETFLTRIAEEQVPELRRYVAHHAHMPQQVLNACAISTDPILREAVATNAHASASLLHQLTQDDEPKVRCVVAHHHRTALGDLELLVRDPDVSVREAVSVHQSLSEYACELLLSDPEPTVRAALGRNLHASPVVLTALACDTEKQVRAAVARNPHLPVNLFLVLLEDSAEEVITGLAGNPQTPPHILRQLVEKPVDAVRRALAGNARLPVELLLQLVEVDDEETRIRVAHNPVATAELLVRLASSKNRRIQAAVAAHKHTPVDTLAWLAQQSGPNNVVLLRALTANPHMPLLELQQLLYTSNVHLQLCTRLVNHPAVVHDHRRLIFDYFLHTFKNVTQGKQHLFFRLQLLHYAELPAPILTTLAHSSIWQERYLVARHPASTRKILRALLHDGNRYVRAAAREELLKHL